MIDSSWTLVFCWRFQSLSCSCWLALGATPIINHLNCTLSLVNVWIPGAWLSKNILHGAYSGFDTLFPSLLYTLDNKRAYWLISAHPDEDDSGTFLVTAGVEGTCLEAIPRSTVEQNPLLGWRVTPARTKLVFIGSWDTWPHANQTEIPAQHSLHDYTYR